MNRYCRGLTASAADPMACIENENSAMGLSIERTAIQYVAASGSIYVQHGSTIALGWFSLHTKWALMGPKRQNAHATWSRDGPRRRNAHATWSQEAIMLTQHCTRMTQDGLICAQHGPQMAQDSSIYAQHGPQMAQVGTKMAPRWGKLGPRRHRFAQS